jgi:hypothetical protein
MSGVSGAPRPFCLTARAPEPTVRRIPLPGSVQCADGTRLLTGPAARTAHDAGVTCLATR